MEKSTRALVRRHVWESVMNSPPRYIRHTDFCLSPSFASFYLYTDILNKCTFRIATVPLKTHNDDTTQIVDINQFRSGHQYKAASDDIFIITYPRLGTHWIVVIISRCVL